MKKLLALISCIVICSICVIPVNANAYPILSDWAKEEAYLAEANDLFPGGEMHDDLRCFPWTGGMVCGAVGRDSSRT